MDWSKTTARRGEKHWSVWMWCSYARGLTVFYILTLLSDCHTHVMGIGVYVGGDTLDMHSFRVGHFSKKKKKHYPWWRHQMETFSAFLVLCEGNPPVTGGFPLQRSVTQSSDVFFDLRPNKRLSKQTRTPWLEMPSRSLWRHCNHWDHQTILGHLQLQWWLKTTSSLLLFIRAGLEPLG